MHLASKQIFRWLGLIASVSGVCFVIFRLREQSSELDLSGLSSLNWWVLFSIMATVGAANVMLALGWRNILAHLNVAISRRQASYIYGISQIAKYVPGNVFHLASRQAMGLSAGLKGLVLAKSSVLELLGLSVVGALFSLLAIPLVTPDWHTGEALFVFVLGVSIAAIVVVLLSGRSIFRAGINYIAYFTVTSLAFLFLIKFLNSGSEISLNLWLPIASAHVLAWLIGLVTIGSPAGLGVREAVLLVLLESVLIGVNLIMAILLWRAITVIADLVYFMASTRLSNLDDRELN